MAIAFRAASTLVDTTGTSISVSKPAGATAGDLIVVIFAQHTTTSTVISPPDNSWFQAPLEDNQTHGDNVRVSMYYHVYGASVEPSTWLFTFATSLRTLSVSVAYSGVNGIDVCSWAAGTGNSAPPTATTASNPGDTALSFVINNSAVGSASVTLDGTLTSRYNLTSGDGHYTFAMGDATVSGTSVPAYANTVGDGALYFSPLMALTTAGTGVAGSVANVGVVPTGTTTQGTTSVAATVPPAIQNGDILVAFLQITYSSSGASSQTTIGIPAGWTKQDEFFQNPTSGTFTLHGAFYTHLITNVGGEPSTYTWTSSGGSTLANMELDMISVRGCSGLDTFSRNASGGGNVTSLASTPITLSTDNEPVLIWGMGSSNAGGPTTGVATLQGEVGASCHVISSAVGTLTGTTTPAYVWQTSGIGVQLLVYQVGFKAALSNIGKIVGLTVVNGYSSVGSTAITIPSGTVMDDLLVAHVMGPHGGTITPPVGWSAITNASADDGNFLAQCFSHIVAPGDPSSVTFTFSGNATGCASIIAFRNTNNSGFLASNNTASGSTPTLTNINTKSLVLMYETDAGNAMNPQQDMFLTLLQYNPVLTLGSFISRFGAVSLLLQTGANGGSIGQQYRSVGGGTGPQITLAITAVLPPTPPPTPPPLPPPPGPGPNLPFVYKGRIAALTNIPPIKNWHDLNKILQQKFVNELPKLITQVVKYASNPQQHYKAVAQALPTVEQTDVMTSDATSGAPAPVISSDVADTFPSTGFVSTLGAGVTVTSVSIPNNTPTSVVTADPIIPMNPGDLVMAVVTGNWAVALYSGIMDITYAGTPSGIIYFQKRINVDSGGNFSDTQIFTAPAGLSNDTGLVFGTSQGSGGSVNITTCTFYVGNLQLR